jgi:ABC-type polar amino acid transport system ATPase subunit
MDFNDKEECEGFKVSLIDVKKVEKYYGDNHILKGVDFSINTGQVKAIMGPSGSGKSTLLRLIALLEPVHSGKILFNGELIAGAADGSRAKPESEKVLALRRRGIGMVFQRFNLFPHLSAVENVMCALTTVQGLEKKDAREQSIHMLERVGLGDRTTFFPSELSGGQQQRVAIARALVLAPQLMLFDEPTSALDPELVREVLKVMEKLAEDGMTMLVVTHEVGFARRVANEVLMFDEGEIVEALPPDQFFTNPAHERTKKFLEHVQ